MKEVFHLIQAQTDIGGVANRMCWCSKGSPTGIAMKASDDFKHYTFRWNMASLTSAKGTIEFRLPPPSASADQTVAWSLFATSFARWAVQHAHALHPAAPGRLSDLQRAVMDGAQLSHTQDPSSIQRIFQGVQPLPDGPLQDLKHISDDEVQALRVKAKERDITLEKYKKLFGFK